MSERDLSSAEGQRAYLTEGCIDVVSAEDLRARLERSLANGKPLVVKVGFDPSSADIHLGHVVLMRKMKQFQDCGHRVVFVVGDFTAMIGDPSGRSKTRPQLSREQIVANAETYRQQAAKILDDARTDFRYNSEWLEPLGSVGLIRLAARYNVARMLERRDFRQRFDSGQSIAVHEFLYPLAQAYDSVALEADVELGGTDQLFNLNVGRDIMPEYGLPPQIVMTTPLLEGLDGVEKMSKSLGNYVAVEDTPQEMFGKLMSISDALMWKYWELLGGVDAATLAVARAASAAGVTQPGPDDVDRVAAALREGAAGREGARAPTLERESARAGGRALALIRDEGLSAVLKDLGTESFHPMSLKAALAGKIVEDFHGAAAAERARGEFQRVFSRRQDPAQVERHERPLAAEGYPLAKLVADLGLAKSNSEARRLIRQGAVRVDGEVVSSEWHKLRADEPIQYLIKVGPHRFAEVRIA